MTTSDIRNSLGCSLSNAAYKSGNLHSRRKNGIELKKQKMQVRKEKNKNKEELKALWFCIE
jgi:hypothetical protein